MHIVSIRQSSLRACIFAGALLTSASAGQAQEQSYALTMHENRFEPAALSVKAGVKFRLTVKNATSKSAEFESAELNREKVVPAGSSAVIYIGPLAPGSYPFFDDFNSANRGQIVAK